MAKLVATETVKQLDKACDDIDAYRQRLRGCRTTIAGIVGSLQAIPSTYSDLLETINDAAYAGTDAHKLANKAMLADISSDFSTLLTDAIALRDWIASNMHAF